MAQQTARRSTLVWVAVLILVVLLLATAAGWYLGSRGPDSQAAAPAVGETAGPGEGDSDSICGLPNGDQSIPQDGPKATWRVERRMTVPVSDKYGPATEEGEDRSCFAHNPTGALFFVLHLQAMPPSVKVNHIVGEMSKSELGPDAVGDGPTFQVEGFKITKATEDRVSLSVAYSTDGETFVAIPATVVWRDGDWKLPAASSRDSQAEDLASLDGYTEWGPQ